MTFGQDRQGGREIRAFGKETFPNIGRMPLAGVDCLEVVVPTPTSASTSRRLPSTWRTLPPPTTNTHTYIHTHSGTYLLGSEQHIGD